MEKAGEGVFGRKHRIFERGSHQARRNATVGFQVRRLLDFLEAIFFIILNKIPKGRCLSTSALPASWVQMLFLEIFTFLQDIMRFFLFHVLTFCNQFFCVSLIPHLPPCTPSLSGTLRHAQSHPGGHAGQPREHPTGGVHPVPVPGPADTPEPDGEHRVQPVPQRVPLDHRGLAQQLQGLLVPHPPDVHGGQLPGVRLHHQRLLLCRPQQEGHHHPGPGAGVHRPDGSGHRGGAHPHHQGEHAAVQHEEAAGLLQASGVQLMMALLKSFKWTWSLSPFKKDVEHFWLLLRNVHGKSHRSLSSKEVEDGFVALENCYVSAAFYDGSSTSLMDIYEGEEWTEGTP